LVVVSAPVLALLLAHFLALSHLFPKRESLYARAVFGRYPQLYELHWLVCNLPIWEETFRSVPRLAGRVLQVGCGSGIGSRIIHNQGNEIVGLDNNLPFLRYGRVKGRIGRALCADACAMAVASSSFDAVLVPVALHHIADHDGLFAECHRVLNPGGRLLIFEPVSLKARRLRRWNTFHDGIIWSFDVGSIRKRITELAHRHRFHVTSTRFFRTRNLQNYNGFYNMTDIVVELRAM
jgi:ubiquinone/menaquinone biosynthesis C-methylase UbiE